MQLIGTVSIAAKSSCVNSLSAALHDCRNPGRRQEVSRSHHFFRYL